MSEKDIALGGAAATKFASKTPNVYQQQDGGDLSYKSSDDVRAHYLKQMEDAAKTNAETKIICNSGDQNSNTLLPPGWEQREKAKEVETKQYGVFSAQGPPRQKSSNNPSVASPSISAEVALLKVATNSLEVLASVVENNQGISLPSEERNKFALALKRAMDAMAGRR